MSEQTTNAANTTTTTNDKKTLLWANVPWGVKDETTKNIQLTGYVDPSYLCLVLAKQQEEKESTTQTTQDTSTSDT